MAVRYKARRSSKSVTFCMVRARSEFMYQGKLHKKLDARRAIAPNGAIIRIADCETVKLQ